MGLDGSVRWCCRAKAPVEGSLALGLFPAGTLGGAPVPTVLFTTTPVTGEDSRLYAAREENAACDSSPSLPLSSLGLGTPSIAADGTVFLAGHGVLVAARFDGLAWATQSFSRATFYEAQPALAVGAGGGIRLVAGNGFTLLESLTFPAPDGAGHRADPVVDFSTTPVAGPPTSSAPVIAADGTVLVSLPTAKTVVALGTDGSVRWKVTLGAQPHPAPVLGDGGLVFVAADDGLVTALELATGAKVWSWNAGGAIGAPLALGCDGLLYGATNTGLVFALVSGSRGPAGPWAREGHDPRGSGDGRRVVQGGPGCAEE